MTARRVLAWPLLASIQAYRLLLRPVLGPPRCRFTPSCSAYALDALRRHGAWRGTGLAVWRVLRCNPLQIGGEDPVPAHETHHRPRGG